MHVACQVGAVRTLRTEWSAKWVGGVLILYHRLTHSRSHSVLAKILGGRSRPQSGLLSEEGAGGWGNTQRGVQRGGTPAKGLGEGDDRAGDGESVWGCLHRALHMYIYKYIVSYLVQKADLVAN